MISNASEEDNRALTVRVGCELVYYTNRPTAAIILVRPNSMPGQLMQSETYLHDPAQTHREDSDSHGNRVDRIILQPGTTTIRHDAMVEVPPAPEAAMMAQAPVPPGELPMSLLRYTFPSRYCDSDRMMRFAADHFDACEPGAPTVRAISEWVHKNIEYRFAEGSPHTAASEILAQGYGVCRDFAHMVVALCRTFNIPTRYATCHLGDIGAAATGTPMDFHAYAEVYLDHKWHPVDARFGEPRIGRIQIACGMDASETALSTFFGTVDLMRFEVWNYQVDPAQVTLQDPLDYSLRLDDTPVVRFKA